MISIIVVSRSIDNLEVLIPSISRAVGGITFELICAWNGDNQPPHADYKNLNVRFETIRPYSFSKNNNLVANYANYETLLFLNDDIDLDKGCIVAAFNLFSKPDVGIVGANLRYSNEKIQHAGIFVNDELMPYHFLKNEVHYLDPRVSYDMDVPAVTGAFLMIDKSEFQAIRFDERCQVAAQDVILCLEYRERFQKKVMYCHDATAIHFENKTRKLFDQKLTPKNDLDLMKEAINRLFSSASTVYPGSDSINLRVVTEKPGWIMYRKGEEIVKRLRYAKINEDNPDANIHYYINYGYYKNKPRTGLCVANFTHFDESLHAEKWVSVAKEVDHCIAVSEEAANNLRRFGILDNKITVIKVGACSSFKPRMTLGIVGRVYEGGRKGEHLIKRLVDDEEVMNGLKIVSTNDSWGVPVWNFDNIYDFYHAVDYLLVPSLIEGGPVPFNEALASGTLSIAPPIGVIPEFPHIEYKTGDFDSLRKTIISTKNTHLLHKQRLSHYMQHHNWSSWANQHICLFQRLLSSRVFEQK